jgi:DUF1009 family protein
MGPRIGIIAGSGEFPALALDEARRKGFFCVVAGIRSEASPLLQKKASEFAWIGAGEIGKLLSFFQKNNVREILMLGKVDPRMAFKKAAWDEAALQVLSRARDTRAATIVRAVIKHLESQGLQVKNPEFLLSPHFCREGILTKTRPAPQVLEDLDLGWRLARAVADLDIGQTVIIKDKAVVAVEGIEGTDNTIRRGKRLAGKGMVVVKVGRTIQDFRVDLPAVGLATVRRLVEASAAALGIEAEKVPFFRQRESLALADAHGLSIVSKKI